MSIVNRSHKHIFIHNPKTAGSSMEILSWIGGSSHKTAYDLRDDIGRYFAWAFIRDPYTRFLSAFVSYQQKGYFKEFTGRKHTLHSWVGFLEKHMVGKPANFALGNYDGMFNFPNRTNLTFPFLQFVPQHYYLCIDGKIAVNFVGRFEKLQTDFAKVQKRLGKIGNLPHINASAPKPKPDIQLRKRIHAIYRKDYKLFNYKKY